MSNPSTATAERPAAAPAAQQERKAALPIIAAERLPYHPAIEERFGIDRTSWRALVEAVFPLATNIDSVVMALSYCRARRLDPFKRVVHIVPIWSKQAGKMVDTVWPGIGELRTTAFRTGDYAGRDDAEFGPDLTEKLGEKEFTFPEWCRISVYRMVKGEKRLFAGPKVYWLEAYATAGRNSVAPNDMWAKRVRGQLEKCAEAAALRAAFPEEIGGDYTNDEAEGMGDRGPIKDITPVRAAATVAELRGDPPAQVAQGEAAVPEEGEAAEESQEADAADQTETPHDHETGEIIEQQPDLLGNTESDPKRAAALRRIAACARLQDLNDAWGKLQDEWSNDQVVWDAHQAKRDALNNAETKARREAGK